MYVLCNYYINFGSVSLQLYATVGQFTAVVHQLIGDLLQIAF